MTKKEKEHDLEEIYNKEDPEEEIDLFDLGDESFKEVYTVDVLNYFGRKRRGVVVNRLIEDSLADNNLTMIPDIEEADYYGYVTIAENALDEDDSPVPSPSFSEETRRSEDGGAVGRGSFLSSLKPDDAEELQSLSYDMTVSDAVEKMRSSGFRKMPLFFDSRDRSTLIGTVCIDDLAFDSVDEGTTRLVHLAQRQVPVVNTNEKLSDWIPSILEHGFIYGRGKDGSVVQIYTTHDVALHLNSVSEMFLRIYELENLLRGVFGLVDEETLRSAARRSGPLHEILDSTGCGPLFTQSDISPQDNGGEERYVETLTFANYMKCMSDDVIWENYFSDSVNGIELDRDRCLRSLNDARLARNRVMHVDRQEVLETLAPSLECLAVWLRKI